MIEKASWMLFGGDAAWQNAEAFAQQHGRGWLVLRLFDDVDPREFGLDIWCRKDGITFSHVAIGPTKKVH